jgi:hypothetical protein
MAELAGRDFPGVYIVDPDDLPAVEETLRVAAAKWGSAESKEELHSLVEREYGIAAWSARLGRVLEGIGA